MNTNVHRARGPSASVFRKENPEIEQLHEKARELAEKQTIKERGQVPHDFGDRKRWFARRSDLQKSRYIELLEQAYHGWFQKFHTLSRLHSDFIVYMTNPLQFGAEMYQRWQAAQKLLDEVRASANRWRHRAEQSEKVLKLLEAASSSGQNESPNQDASLSSNCSTVPVHGPPPIPAVSPDCESSFMISPLTATDVPPPVPQQPHNVPLYSIFGNEDSDADYSDNNALGNHTNV